MTTNWAIFCRELDMECRFALVAFSDMKRSYANTFRILDGDKGPRTPARLQRNDDRFWYSLIGFLDATSRISKFFWPSGSKRNPGRDHTRARSWTLREALGIRDDSPLRSRALRDSFEHFDERIDRRLEISPFGYMLDHETVPKTGEEKWGSVNLGRRLDPDTWTLSFEGDELELMSVVGAVRDLARQLRLLRGNKATNPWR